MSSQRERALSALLTTLRRGTGVLVERETVVPERIPHGGLVIVRDGQRSDPEVAVWPLTYYWEHAAELDVLVQAAGASERAAGLDRLLIAIETSLEGDRTLGGVVTWAEATGLVTNDLAIPAGVAVKGAVVTITLLYATPSVLG